ncbi:MAG TPA: 2-dehydropantoate 2-reductase [Acidobacteriota bacterium]|nr:2-dehydropantoate 2-reductase [Acidobacteriota bacterium]
MSRTIGIIGAGPVGGILAAHLSSAGNTVILVDAWKEHIEKIRADGLHITGQAGISSKLTHLLTSVEALGAFAPEFVFICTKACDLDNVLEGMGESLRRSKAVFISFQNGIDTEQAVAERIGRHRVLRGVVSYAGVLVGPGEIRRSFFTPPNYLGWLDERGAEPCKEAAAVLSASGLATEATKDIGRYVWRKAILNSCTMSIAAITGMTIQEMIEFSPTAQLVELLLQESVAVAAAFGYDYGPGFVESVRDFNNHAGPHKPSMRVDIENGRRTENPFLIRRIAECAEQKGVPAPLHRTVANLIDALEKKALERR